MSKKQPEITIVYEEIQTGGKSLGSMTANLVKKVGVLDPEALSNNLSEFCNSMIETFEGVVMETKNYELDSFELSVEVTASGAIRFIGSMESEVKGGLCLTFKKRRSENKI